VLDQYGVELIGAKIESIKKAEDGCCSKTRCARIGLETPQSQLLRNIEEDTSSAAKIGYPLILRPEFLR